MKCNVGNKDRTLRVIAGIAVIGVGLYFGSWWGAVGLVPLLTGALGWCPAYFLFGLSTCERKQEDVDKGEFSGCSVG